MGAAGGWRAVAWGVAAVLGMCAAAGAREYDVSELTPRDGVCRSPVLSDTGQAAWVRYTGKGGDKEFIRGDLWVCPAGGEPVNLTGERDEFSGRVEAASLYGDAVMFLGWYDDKSPEEGLPFNLVAPERSDEMRAMEEEYPSLFNAPVAVLAAKDGGEGKGGEDGGQSGKQEGEEGEDGKVLKDTLKTNGGGGVALWKDGKFERLTPGGYAFYGPSLGEAGAGFQCARAWPYGYEAVAWSPEGGLKQLTTNYFYVLDVKAQGRQLVYQAWDGNDYEIYLYDFDKDETQQLTSNTFDDVHPDLWGGQVVWTAYPIANGEIFLWSDGIMKKISDNSRDNDAACICDGRVVWQGLDEGECTEIFYYDGKKTIKLTSNIWDDLEPKIRGNTVAWVSYVDLADAEIMALDLRDNIPVQLTNDGEEDGFVSIGGDRVVWQTSLGDNSFIRMAVGKPIEEKTEE